MSSDSRTPVTILTGFLGAGKTTLLNRLIAERPNKRFAIIENEFGETNIDSDLVVGAEEDIFELSNGCICCSISGALTDTLALLIQRRGQYDHLLIETTGIANPQAVAAPFIADPTVQKHFRLDATLCLVDTAHLEEALRLQKEATWQISAADLLIFNKIDLVSAEQLEHVRSIAKKINPLAQLLQCQDAAVDTTSLLDLQAFSTTVFERQSQDLDPLHDHHHHHISSQTYHFTEALDLIKFRHFIQVLLLFQSSRIYRMKGIINFSGNSHRMIFQSIQKQTVLRKGSVWEDGTKRASKLVIIGKGLDRSQFEKRLKSCLA